MKFYPKKLFVINKSYFTAQYQGNGGKILNQKPIAKYLPNDSNIDT